MFAFCKKNKYVHVMEHRARPLFPRIIAEDNAKDEKILSSQYFYENPISRVRCIPQCLLQVGRISLYSTPCP